LGKIQKSGVRTAMTYSPPTLEKATVRQNRQRGRNEVLSPHCEG
jgi:hypothetical protein